MKKIIYLLMLCTPLLLSSQNRGIMDRYVAQLTTPKGYICYRTTGKIKIDGKLNEKSWQLAPSTDDFVDIQGDAFPIPAQKTSAKMLWDDDYLYVGGVIYEKDIIARLNQRDTIIYHDNDFEVFLNPNGDGHNYFEIETNAKGTIMDLMLDRPYRNGGHFLMQWDCPNLKLAVHIEGTLNNSKDIDKYWSVEMAIPRQAVSMDFDNPLKKGKYWRLNFSRVEWVKNQPKEENWVWSPIGKIDMHQPERWGFIYFSDKESGSSSEQFSYPYNMDIYKLLWGMFYAQQDKYTKDKNYLRRVEDFMMSKQDTENLPSQVKIDIEATSSSFLISISDLEQGVVYRVDHEGKFKHEKVETRLVKNWVWTRVNNDKSEQEYKKWFSLLKECGISGVLFEGYSEKHYRMCKEAGLEAHHWKWTLNRSELLDVHPEWFAVNRLGESCYDKPAYVSYYRFLCPNRQGVAEYLAADYVKELSRPYVDGVHLDYVRFPDVILPVSLWKNYGIEQTTELPQYDYCYCEVCCKKFKEQTGADPKDLKYPMQNQSWLNFRYDAVTRIVEAITSAVKQNDGFISGAVFPGPSMARNMVRQDWGNWGIDAYFPMIYNGFYFEGPQWIGRSVKESVQTINGRGKIYAGLMFPDIKDDFTEALDAAFDNGASGISFFDGPSEEYLIHFKKYLDKKGYKTD